MRARLCIQPVCQELAHGGIHHRVAGAPCSPGGEICGIIAARGYLAAQGEKRLAHGWEVIQDGDIELAPDQLVQPGLRAAAGIPVDGLRLGLAGGPGCLAGREHPKTQVGR